MLRKDFRNERLSVTRGGNTGDGTGVFLKLLVLALLLGAGGCVSVTRISQTETRMVGTREHWGERLFLGREIPGGGRVSEEEWREFLDETVTPRFPEGLTVWRAEGQWMDLEGRIVEEETFVLEIFRGDGREVERAIEEIAREYKKRFRQDSVLRVTVPVGMRFYE